MDQYREAADPKKLAEALRNLADRVGFGEFIVQSFAVGVGEKEGTFEMTIVYTSGHKPILRHEQHQASDMMCCSCGKRWDMNDPHPPEGCIK